MASRYWRLRAFSTSFSDITELYFLDSGFVDLLSSVGGTNNGYNTTSTAANAFDRNTSTVASALTSSSLLLLGTFFNSPVDVTYVDITTAGSPPRVPDINSLYLETSEDGVTWQISFKLSLLSGTWAINQTCRFSLVAFTTTTIRGPTTPNSNYYGPHAFNNIVWSSIRNTSGSNATSNIYTRSIGKYKVVGTVKIFPATPVKKKIILFRQRSNTTVDQTFSDPITGAFSFLNLSNDIYYAVAIDETGVFNGEIFTDIQPILM